MIVTVLNHLMECARFVDAALVAPILLPSTNNDPDEGATANDTIDLPLKSNVHVAPQLIPATVLVTIPVPMPALDTTNVALVIADAVFEYAESPTTLKARTR